MVNGVALAPQRLYAGGIAHLYRGNALDLPPEVWLCFGQAEDVSPIHPLHQRADAPAGQPKELTDGTDHPNIVKVFALRVFHGQVPLGDQKDGAANFHRVIQGLNRLGTGHIKLEQHTGKYRKSP